LIQNHRAELVAFSTHQFTVLPGLEGLCLGLPRVLFSALGGAIVDRADRKIILCRYPNAVFAHDAFSV